jgi:hypothetical protein
MKRQQSTKTTTRRRTKATKRLVPPLKPFLPDLAFEAVTDEAAAVWDRLSDETPRGCALVAGAALDELLGALLTAFCTNDDDLYKALLYAPGAPLGTFSARILACRGIGLITDDLFRDLETVRYVRNQAAHFDRRRQHGHEFSFERSDIADRCRNLRSVPTEFLQTLSARELFESFVGMAASCLAEHAVLWKVTADHIGEAFAREGMFELVPNMKLKNHIGRFLMDKRSESGAA